MWDPWSASLYVKHGEAIMRITGDEVSLLAESVREGGQQERGQQGRGQQGDGASSESRYLVPSLLASDGAGALYCAGPTTVRKVQLPAALQASSAGFRSLRPGSAAWST